MDIFTIGSKHLGLTVTKIKVGQVERGQAVFISYATVSIQLTDQTELEVCTGRIFQTRFEVKIKTSAQPGREVKISTRNEL